MTSNSQSDCFFSVVLATLNADVRRIYVFWIFNQPNQTKMLGWFGTVQPYEI